MEKPSSQEEDEKFKAKRKLIQAIQKDASLTQQEKAKKIQVDCN